MEEKKVSTGSDILDGLLDGGYENDAITTFYGPAGVGKTNVALLAAISAVQKGKKVIFIDSEGGFSVARLKQLVSNHKKIIENVLFLKPTNFAEQCRMFEKLKSLVNNKIGLIVVDTISMLYRLERKFGDEGHDFNRELGMQIACLSEITRKKSIPIVVINQVYTGFDTGKISMVGGDILKYGSKVLIELQSGNNGVRKAVLRKHRSIAVDKEVLFRIVEDGFERC
ncbi:DNA repair and recombination protein RadB [Candidatus Woesearchaeota archaeon]|nr:DNA repair and recombination protein RadB [Candidatus Woesearchaeota archaeon]